MTIDYDDLGQAGDSSEVTIQNDVFSDVTWCGDDNESHDLSFLGSTFPRLWDECLGQQ